MAYTVQEVAKLSGTTVKTLYHYQKVGLLFPNRIGENGYRYYTEKEMERLQQILFYRELDFSLEQIKIALESEPDRQKCLEQQKILLNARKARLCAVLDTLEETLSHARKGDAMSTQKMFTGLNKDEWENALQDQKQHLQKEYDYSMITDNIDPNKLNAKAEEASRFLSFMSESLQKGLSAQDERVLSAIKEHIAFLNRDRETNAKSFALQTKFFLSDDFHRNMLENQQVGLSYYLAIAAENLAAKTEGK